MEASKESEENENKNNTDKTDTVIELETKESDNIEKNDDSTIRNAEQPTFEEMQKRLKARPTLKDLINHKTTWREFLGVYNVLRITIAAVFAVLIFLSIAGMAYLLNPNTCKRVRTKSNRIQYHPIANMLVLCFSLSLVVIPMFKIIGHEWLWSQKKINIIILIVICCIFASFMPYPFLLNVSYSMYLNVVFGVIAVVFIIYAFISDGFYLFWFIFPWIITFLLVQCIITGFAWIFDNIIPPKSYFFGLTYTLMLSLLQTVLLKYPLFSFPYKWGKWCTCPWNKNKNRRIIHNYKDDKKSTIEDELSDSVLFYFSMIFISLIETERVAGYVLAKDEHFGFNGLTSMILFAVIFECIARNNLISELIYQKILKKPVPAWERTYSIWYGSKYQADYVPIWCILFMNLVKYGPVKHCGHVRDAQLTDNANMGDDMWWLFCVMFGAETLSIVSSEIVLRIGRYFKWFGVKDENGEDLPRKTILVKVNLFPQMWILVHSYIVSNNTFWMDTVFRTD